MFKLIKLFFKIPGPRYPWKKVGLILSLSSFVISGSASASYIIYRYAKHHIAKNGSNLLQAIVQTTSQTGYEHANFETGFFAETLDLSSDKPTTLAEFDLNEAQKKLLGTQVFQDVNLKKMKPDILFIRYTSRVPYLLLADFSNTAMDREGGFFPYMPFYSPRKLPLLYLGQVEHPWGKKINQEQLGHLQTLIEHLGFENIDFIDLSQAVTIGAGRREIVVRLKEGCLLRLTPKNYGQQLARYSILKSAFLKKDRASIIDLRVPEVAYIQR